LKKKEIRKSEKNDHKTPARPESLAGEKEVIDV